MQVSVASSGPQVCGRLAWWARARPGAGSTWISYRTRRTAGRPGAGALREGGCGPSGLLGWALLLRTPMQTPSGMTSYVKRASFPRRRA
uniref:Phosducin-like 3 n=1 Tax=Mus musculus TaxID=10090 RepID=A0A0A6YVT6_MOUSE